MDFDKKNTGLVKKLEEEQLLQLRSVLLENGWELTDAPYCFYKAKKEKTTVAAYTSGKLVVQGKGTADFVEFLLEPYITGVELPEEQEPFSPHAGIDESGKGDFFGPLVVSCVYVENEDVAEKLSALGVRDSKQIKSDKKIAGIASEIMKLVQGKFAIVVIGPEAYNRAYAKIGSLNRLLAWGHARSLENLLEKAPECPAALADKFGDEHLIRNALLENGRKIHLDQRTKAESDIAVAAASILARAEFVRRLEALAGIAGVDTLPKGAGSQVDSVAAQIAGSGGAELLEKISKRHFTTFEKALKNGKS
ncbi:MAG: ribonuclease HIII [Lentisphaerae bacterium]|jgi:ribonuclease HIII|nr:ribonuclease HIII [Lentisphaerota bacterium]